MDALFRRAARLVQGISSSLFDPDNYVIELFEHTGADQSDALLREPIRR